MDRASCLQERLWSAAVAAVEARPTVAISLFVQSLDNVIDFDAKRRNALDDRIPTPAWMTPEVVSILAAFLTGYFERKRFSLLNSAVPIAIAVVLGLIADLDAPHSGSIEVSKQQMMRFEYTLAAVPQRLPGSSADPNGVAPARPEAFHPK